MSRSVVVVSHDPGWREAFRDEARRLLGVFGTAAEGVYHVGSTSVPGLAAKPIIDILVVLRDIAEAEARRDDLAALGYQWMGEYGLPGRRHFRRSVDGRRTHHVHAYAAGHHDIHRHLVYRDYLCRHADVAADYARVKRRAAAAHPDDFQAYADAKASFVQRTERDALRWAASVPLAGAAPQAVLFDADGVIQRTPADWREAVGALCGDATRVEAFLADVFAAEKPCLTGAAEFPVALAAVLERWQSPASLDEALDIWRRIDVDEAVLGLVGRVRALGICTVLATNQQPVRAEFMTEELGYGGRFDVLAYSCRVGLAKPSPDYFRTVTADLGLTPRQALFLDDHPANVKAAAESGLAAAVFHVDQGVAELERLLRGHGIAV